MKTVIKGNPPESLVAYVSINPTDTWHDMRRDLQHNGKQAAKDCRKQAIDNQGGICAYCEQTVLSDNPNRRRIEHFHSKSDRDDNHNWDLDWRNMFVVCDGGSYKSKTKTTTDERDGDSKSCDVHKDQLIQKGELPARCEGYLLNPLTIPPFPSLFSLNKENGHLVPNDNFCYNEEIANNKYDTTEELIRKTIEILNLNCNRIADNRLEVIKSIDHFIKLLRSSDCTPAEARKSLLQRFFSDIWPEYFTTIRCCLGDIAEDYLESIGYEG